VAFGEIYGVQGVIVGVKAALESRPEKEKGREEERKVLMECLAELYVHVRLLFPSHSTNAILGTYQLVSPALLCRTSSPSESLTHSSS